MSSGLRKALVGWLGRKLQSQPSPLARQETIETQAHQILASANAMLNAGRLLEAEHLYRQALQINASDTVALVNLGFVLLEQNRLLEARAYLTDALAADPTLHDAHFMLGNIARQNGELDLAIACYEKALSVQPDFGDCARSLCVLLAQTGEFTKARALLETGRAFQRESLDYHFFGGTLYLAQEQFSKAAAEFRRAADIAPGNVNLLKNLGLTLHRQGDVFGATEVYQQILLLDPNDVATHGNLGGAFQICGETNLAEHHYREALRLDPSFKNAWHNLLYALSFRATPVYDDYLREAQKFGTFAANRSVSYASPRSGADRLPGAPLRIGFVSGDFRNHPVGFFLENVVKHIDSSKLQLVAYSTRSNEDDLTARIKASFGQWHTVEDLSDESLTERVCADRIDVLVDLAGHTEHNRLLVFAARAAPVQVSWLGYWASTGVSEIDYILVDPISVPDHGRQFLLEQPWYLPDTRLCLSSPVTTKPMHVAPLPALTNGFVTFGSFQILSKLSDETLLIWGQVMTAVPTSRLRLQNWQLGHAAGRADVERRLIAAGISLGRVDIYGGCNRELYLAAHSQVDYILDTFPFPGGTTTVEAFWMGVPTLTLTGATLLARQGESLLRCVGLDDWVASTQEEYVALATEHAADLGKLSALRMRLRDIALVSPLFDAARFARHLEQAFLGMWDAKHQKASSAADG